MSDTAPCGRRAQGAARATAPAATTPRALMLLAALVIGCTGPNPGGERATDVDGAGTGTKEEKLPATTDTGASDRTRLELGGGRDDPAVVPVVEAMSTGRDGATQPNGEPEARAGDASEAGTKPAFRWDADELAEATHRAMEGVTWRPGCPIGRDELHEVELTHHGFDGTVHTGRLVAHASVVDDLEEVFATMFEVGFPLETVAPAHRFDGDDEAIMAANATHAFNCRPITGGGSWSEHSFGTAIDINPRQNPYERDATVLPPDGAAYLDRSEARDGMLREDGPVVAAFDRLGWDWGGRWRSLVDYMHFEVP